jgi:hypothetical protein
VGHSGSSIPSSESLEEVLAQGGESGVKKLVLIAVAALSMKVAVVAGEGIHSRVYYIHDEERTADFSEPLFQQITGKFENKVQSDLGWHTNSLEITPDGFIKAQVAGQVGKQGNTRFPYPTNCVLDYRGKIENFYRAQTADDNKEAALYHVDMAGPELTLVASPKNSPRCEEFVRVNNNEIPLTWYWVEFSLQDGGLVERGGRDVYERTGPSEVEFDAASENARAMPSGHGMEAIEGSPRTDASFPTVTLYPQLDGVTNAYKGGRSCFNFQHGPVEEPASQAWNLAYGLLRLAEQDWFTLDPSRETRSVIRDLGARTWEDSIEIPVLKPRPVVSEGQPHAIVVEPPSNILDAWEKDEMIQAKVALGHMYLLHVKDESSDFYAMFRVERFKQNEYCTISWRLVPSPRTSEEF